MMQNDEQSQDVFHRHINFWLEISGAQCVKKFVKWFSLENSKQRILQILEIEIFEII